MMIVQDNASSSYSLTVTLQLFFYIPFSGSFTHDHNTTNLFGNLHNITELDKARNTVDDTDI